MSRTPVFPHHHVPLPREGGPTWLHAAELASTLALGQRALVVGPARSAKTTILREIGKSIAARVPDATIDVVVVDQDIEEFMEWRAELPQATVHGTSSDEPPEAHAEVEQPFVDAQARAEAGGDAVILIDSIAALARALNATMPYDERILTGGIMQAALKETRRLFGLARAFAEGGSLTIVAVAATDTSSELDDVVFHELVGTGNMEIRTSLEVRDSALFPPLDIVGSGARHLEGIIGTETADRRARLRDEIHTHGPTAGLALLLNELDRAGSLDALL